MGLGFSWASDQGAAATARRRARESQAPSEPPNGTNNVRSGEPPDRADYLPAITSGLANRPTEPTICQLIRVKHLRVKIQITLMSSPMDRLTLPMKSAPLGKQHNPCTALDTICQDFLEEPPATSIPRPRRRHLI